MIKATITWSSLINGSIHPIKQRRNYYVRFKTDEPLSLVSKEPYGYNAASDNRPMLLPASGTLKDAKILSDTITLIRTLGLRENEVFEGLEVDLDLTTKQVEYNGVVYDRAFIVAVMIPVEEFVNRLERVL